MGGTTARSCRSWSREFNQEPGSRQGQPQYKGAYDDTLSAYKAALNSGQAPDLVQVYDIGTRFMIDSKSTVPVQSFVDADTTTSRTSSRTSPATTRSTTSCTRCRSTRRCLAVHQQEAFDKAGSTRQAAEDARRDHGRAQEDQGHVNGETQYGFGARSTAGSSSSGTPSRTRPSVTWTTAGRARQQGAAGLRRQHRAAEVVEEDGRAGLGEKLDSNTRTATTPSAPARSPSAWSRRARWSVHRGRRGGEEPVHGLDRLLPEDRHERRRWPDHRRCFAVGDGPG